MSGSEPIASYQEFERHLFLLEDCGHHRRAQNERQKGFLVWRRCAIDKDLPMLKRTMERYGGSIGAGIRTIICEMESELEELRAPFTTA